MRKLSNYFNSNNRGLYYFFGLFLLIFIISAFDSYDKVIKAVTETGDTVIIHGNNDVIIKPSDRADDIKDTETSGVSKFLFLVQVCMATIGFVIAGFILSKHIQYQIDRARAKRCERMIARKEKKIILIEESDGVSDRLKTSCEAVGFLLTRANNLVEALTIVHLHQVAIIDIKGIDKVIEFVDTVRSCNDDIIIITTKYIEVNGINYTIKSPISSKELVKLLIKILK